MNRQQQQSIYLPDGSNAAPMFPLKELKDQSPEAEKNIEAHTLTQNLKKKYEDLMSKDKESWREMISAGRIIALFIEGEQILKINSFNGMPSIQKPNKKDPMHIKCINDMQFYATTWQDKWRSSKPDVLVSPYSNDDQANSQARKANMVVDYLEQKWYNNWFDLDEGLMAQIWGWYGRRVRPDWTSKSFSALRKILGEKEVPIGKGYGKCECGYRGSETKKKQVGKAQMNACPECESLEYDYELPVTQIIPGTVGQEKIFIPDIICEPLYFPCVRFDLSKRAEESPWFINERSIEEGSLRRIIGTIRFPEGESGNDFGLDTIEHLAKRGAAMNGRSDVSDGKSQRITLTEMYLSPDDLWDIQIGKDEKTVEGHTLPQKRMSEVFPNGCCVVGINGMSLILGIYAEHHSECVTAGIYHMKAMSGAGRGVGDAVEIQKQKNRRYNQIDKFFQSRSTWATLVAEGALDDGYKRQLNNPNAIIPVKMQNFPDKTSPDQLIRPLQGESVPGDLIHVTFDRLREMMQTAYHITDLGGARPMGVKNDTATFAEIVASNADAIFSPVLSIKADVCVDTAKKGFKKWCKYTPVARFIPGKTRGETISGKDVDGEYQWSYAQGSEAPKTRHTENQKKAMFFNLFGGVPGYFMAKQQFPKQIAEIERDFDVNFESESYDEIGEVCRMRWDDARKQLQGQSALASIGQAFGVTTQPNYFDILMNVTPSLEVTEPNLGEQVAWFQNLLITEEGRRMSPEERKLVSAFIVALKELAKGQSIEQQRDAVEAQMAANQPVVDAENERAAAEAQAGQAQSEQEMAAQGLQVLNENEQAEEARTLEREKMAHEQAMQNKEHVQQIMTQGEQ